MTVKFESKSEAFLAVLSLVVAADRVGSLAERDFLFDKVKEVDLFKGLARGEFMKLLGEATEKVYTSVPQEGDAPSPAAVDALLDSAKTTLGPELSKTLLKTATLLAEADESDESETVLLKQIERKLG